MKFVAQVKGNIADYMRVEAESGARAASRVMGEETRNLQLGLRAQVNSAFGPKGRGIGNGQRVGRSFWRSPLASMRIAGAVAGAMAACA